MKKKRKAYSIALAVLLIVGMSNTALAANFTDTVGHWSESYVDKANNNGLVNGVGGGKFNPDATVSTAEWATMVVNLFYVEERNANQELYGAFGGWWYPYMITAADTGILTGTVAFQRASNTQSIWSFGSDEYSPDRAMSRYDMAQVIYNLAVSQAWDISASSSALTIPDVTAIPAQYISAVNYCYNAGFITGVDGHGTFAGSSSMTRGAAAVVLCRLFDTKESGSIQPVQKPIQEPVAVSLNGIALSSTLSDVTEVLGAPKATYDYDGGKTIIKVYHDGNYGAFYLVGYENEHVMYVYSIGRTYTIEGDSSTGTKAEYTDSNNSSSVYAASIAANAFVQKCTNEASSEKLVYELTNAFRVLCGVSALTWNDALGQAAHDHTQNMFEYKKLTHDGLGVSEGMNFSARAKAAGYTGFPAGENCSMGHSTPVGFINAWINSSGHRANILKSEYQHIGVGVVGNYSTQVFGYVY